MPSNQTVPLLLLVTWIVSTAPLSISSLPRNPLNSNSGVIRSISPHRSSFPLFCDPSVRDDDVDGGNDHAVDEISSELQFGRRIVKGLAKVRQLETCTAGIAARSTYHICTLTALDTFSMPLPGPIATRSSPSWTTNGARTYSPKPQRPVQKLRP